MARRLVLLLTLVLSSINAAPDSPDALAAKSQRAKQALLAKRYDEAAGLYRELVNALPTDAGLRFNLGMTLYSAGGYSEAIRELKAAVSGSAAMPPAWLVLGMAYSKLDRPADALEPLRRAVSLQPGSALAHLELADALLASGQPAPAAKEFNTVVQHEPRNARALLGLALSYMALPNGATSEAARQAVEKLSDLPPSPEAHELLAQTYAASNRRTEAIAEWRAALAMAPQDGRLKARLAEALRDNREYEEASQILASLVNANATPRVEYLLGDVLFRQGQSEQALPHLVHAVTAAPDLLPAHGVLGRIYLQIDKPERAIPHLERAANIDKDGSINHQLGVAYRKLGEKARADAAFAREQSLRSQSGLTETQN